MRERLEALWVCIRCRINHPSPGSLMQSIDGELEAGAADCIQHHLLRCDSCREKVDDLRRGLQTFEQKVTTNAPSLALDKGLHQLLAAVAKLDTDVSNSPATPAIAYERISEELSIYVGRPAARKLLDRCTSLAPQREQISAVIGPVMTEFFGEHAAAAVMASVLRIWDQSQKAA